MNKRQFNTLKRLFFLWLRVIAHDKYMLFKNLVFIFSIFLNFYFFYKLNDLSNLFKETITNSKQSILSQVYDIKNYKSVAKENENLSQRFDKLYKRYLEDKMAPNYTKYKPGKKIDASWERYCTNNLRRIVNIQSRIKDLEVCLYNLLPEDREKINDIIITKRYEEVLSDMSNYYSQFLTTDKYDHTIQTSD
jgi:hypothetical protein